MEEQLNEQIKVVIEARELAREANERKIEAYQKWVDDHSQLIANESDAKNYCQEAETKLRELTLEAYSQTGNKAPVPGVTVKIFQTLDYDPKEALKWALHHEIALSLDKKSFETFAKATPLEFVSITEEPRAQIATQL